MLDCLVCKRYILLIEKRKGKIIKENMKTIILPLARRVRRLTGGGPGLEVVWEMISFCIRYNGIN